MRARQRSLRGDHVDLRSQVGAGLYLPLGVVLER